MLKFLKFKFSGIPDKKIQCFDFCMIGNKVFDLFEVWFFNLLFNKYDGTGEIHHISMI